MAVAGQTPTRIHLMDSDTVTWEQVGSEYVDPNDPTKLVRDIKAHDISGEVAGITIDGGTTTPTTGSKGYLQIPFAATITGWTLLADAAGAAQITVKKCSDAGFPTTTSIVAAAPPALVTSQQKNGSSSLGTWTVDITANDILEFVLDSVITCKRLTLELKLTRA